LGNACVSFTQTDDHLSDLGVNGRIILKRHVKEIGYVCIERIKIESG
jgi:hypothetical protein